MEEVAGVITILLRIREEEVVLTAAVRTSLRMGEEEFAAEEVGRTTLHAEEGEGEVDNLEIRALLMDEVDFGDADKILLRVEEAEAEVAHNSVHIAPVGMGAVVIEGRTHLLVAVVAGLRLEAGFRRRNDTPLIRRTSS